MTVRHAAPMHRMTTHMTRFVVSPVCGALLSGAGVGVTAAVGSAVGAGEGSVEGTGVGSVLGEGSDSVAYARTNGEKLVVVNSKYTE